ncbi:hypothetical protein JK386_04935 [Nocardioides sp. zg-536]|uniref:Wadjet protein JetD C-terminal domain-containing protein n=1 Tax=Nocardioides faecalis TaxID=2803858 RepID=A0A939BXD6_9ACTN|nr:hypothetical protein [Nocardioides faecalis]MBM9459238.1 hypothetical protein [Nocardioides faecalis]QVI59627.1 hypothetical protein KG111_04580 [Nocardioides faecalis]
MTSFGDNRDTPPAPSSRSELGGGSLVERLADALAVAINAHKVRRVPLQVLRAAHARHDPTGSSDSSARADLANAIEVLTGRGTVTVPRSALRWERHLDPPLPFWVERPSVQRTTRTRGTARVWRPELAVAGAMAATDSEFEVLERLEPFLREGGAVRPVVPHRERSVELFGNEKRLDSLLRTRLFTSGALTLDLLRCYVAPLPLTAQHTGPPGPVVDLLIVENHATYASVLTVARERVRGGRPAVAVGYGTGNQLPAAIGGATQLDPPPDRLWYFGDLDAGGLKTASAAAVAATAAGLPPLRPSLPLYRALLSAGVRQPGQTSVPSDVAQTMARWLEDAQVCKQAADLLASGHRLAQESVGYETLRETVSWW